MKHLLPTDTLTLLPEISLVAFFVVFSVVILWVMRPSAKTKYENAGNLPLESEEEKGRI